MCGLVSNFCVLQGSCIGNDVPSPEELEVALRFVLVIKGNSLFDLRELGLDPGVLDIAMGVQFRKRFQALISAAMIDEPTGTLGEQQNKRDKDCGWNKLDGEGNYRKWKGSVSNMVLCYRHL